MTQPDFERRFGGLRRLYGPAGAQAIFNAHVIVVGIGGVGSWAAEALARSGVGQLTLIDLDHVSESNINRQIHALGTTLGQSKVQAMRQRIADINPACHVHLVDDFLTPDNLASLLPATVPPPGSGQLALLDACDQVRAKTALAAWAQAHSCLHITVGAAGGKQRAQAAEVADLADVTHDPLLAQLRYRLRKHHGASRIQRMGVSCVFSRENVAPPDAACQLPGTHATATAATDSSLNCHGYGSVVTVTATFGLVAAGHLLGALAKTSTISAAASKPPKMTL
ncbi:MAG: tRNA threonylcarbamoyladenosine dehydratase [Polaromonas sp.]|nr:tRNA threonylcarbamoyladenosine dehydratase [Polaromonas sp.]